MTINSCLNKISGLTPPSKVFGLSVITLSLALSACGGSESTTTVQSNETRTNSENNRTPSPSPESSPSPQSSPTPEGSSSPSPSTTPNPTPSPSDNSSEDETDSKEQEKQLIEAMVGPSLLSSEGGFERDREDFLAVSVGESIIYGETDFSDGEADVTILQTSVDTWHYQLLHEVTLVEGETYTICYDAKADQDREISINIDNGEPTYDSIIGGEEIQAIETSYQSYAITFDASESDSEARLNFNLAGSDESVQLDNIGIYDGEYCPGDLIEVDAEIEDIDNAMAIRGEKLYNSSDLNCSGCHGDMLPEAPSSGNKIIDPDDLPDNLVNFIEENMPGDDPTKCENDCAEDIAAYLETFSRRPETFSKDLRGAELFTREEAAYGKIVMRMRAAKGSGIISNFFTYKQGSEMENTPWEEIDIEIFGKDNAETWQSNIITGTGDLTLSEGVHRGNGSFADDYHTFTVEWTPEYVSWLVDGQLIRKDDNSNPQVAELNKPEGLRFNIWQPSPVSWVGPFDDDILPVHMFVNWVEFYSYDNGSFDLEWRDDFNSLDRKRWLMANWTFDVNNTDFTQENVNIADGKLVLSVTKKDATGFNGTPPIDSDD